MLLLAITEPKALQPHPVLSFLRGDTGKTLSRALYVMERCSKSQVVADKRASDCGHSCSQDSVAD